MGSADRTIRILVALAIGIFYFTNVITGTWATVLAVISVVFLLTSFIGWCPLYSLFGINSCKTKK